MTPLNNPELRDATGRGAQRKRRQRLSHQATFHSAEEAKGDVKLRFDDVGTPTPAQMPLDVVGESGSAIAYSIAVNSDDISEIEFERKHPEGSREFRIPLNVPQEEPSAKCPVSRDEVHLSQARREIRRNFPAAGYIRRFQAAGSPIVIARVKDYAQIRHGATMKLDGPK
ncbi:hypothetical protein PENCOP_c003G01122 [Penicillium coprophilum]|uniref:Uncharacterized protein n=1 Tax=Penicillium coprophilum TaxID=36646 RepID=A0A1V6UXF5_9EURO|nr:hypothetical protein PENCOP_c003G01122 [Penicillium coprophilum]